MAEYDAEVSDDPLYVLRHSTAHLLAAAVTELFPGARYAGGPPVENGFYYDFELSRPLSQDDLEPIQKRMAQIVARGDRFRQELLPHPEAVRRFEERDQPYKLYWINRKASDDELVSTYWTGDFLDLCRGPHVASAADIPAFKLMRVAGAYWLGDERNPQLSRVYGTAWFSEEELEDYLRTLAEAEKRDHKRLGRELRIFALDERTGVGNVLWLPNGATIRRELERWIVDEELARGYQHVVTPVFGKLDLYKQSGHWERYHDTMYPPMEAENGEELELRPMNCPHHILVYESELRSYRDLPLRIAEIGNNYRWEKSGELMGMIRVRSFALNDAHIFCTPEQLHSEIVGAIELARYFMDTLGVTDYRYRLSVRDPDHAKYVGTDEQWANAERALADALEALGETFELGVGEAAFYGPKIDFQVRDAHRRRHGADDRLPDRALRGRLPDLAGPAAGGGPADHGRARAVRQPGRGAAAPGPGPRRGGRARRAGGQEDRGGAQPQGALHGDRRRPRGRGRHRPGPRPRRRAVDGAARGVRRQADGGDRRAPPIGCGAVSARPAREWAPWHTSWTSARSRRRCGSGTGRTPTPPGSSRPLAASPATWATPGTARWRRSTSRTW